MAKKQTQDATPAEPPRRTFGPANTGGHRVVGRLPQDDEVQPAPEPGAEAEE